MKLNLKNLTMAATLTTSLSAFAQQSDANVGVPQSMGALGDSITAGAFANWSRSQGYLPWNSFLFIGELLEYEAAGANNDVIDRPYLNWSTGHDLFDRMTSHKDFIQKLNGGRDIPYDNEGITGALVHDVIVKELPKFEAWSQKNLGAAAPEYVTLLIGANDICSAAIPNPTPTGQYISDMSLIVDEILTKSPKTKLMVLSMPQVQKLRDVLATQTDTGGAVGKTCADMWAITKECARVTLETDPAKQAIVAQQIEDYFLATQQMINDRIAKYGDRVRFSTLPHDLTLTPDDVAMDCFHPGPVGQNRLSTLSWPQTWWADKSTDAQFVQQRELARQAGAARKADLCKQEVAGGADPSQTGPCAQ